MDEQRLAELLASALEEALHKRRTISDEMHADHHAFVQILIEEREKRTRRIEKIKTQVLGWGIISLLGGVAYMIGDYAKHLFK